MKKIIAAIGLSLSLTGCAFYHQKVEVRQETVDHKSEYKRAFVELVLFVRKNQFNTNPSKDVQQRLDRLIFDAGMEMRNLPSGKRRLVYNGLEVSFDHDMVQIQTSPSTVVKTDDLNKAAGIIYDSSPQKLVYAK